MGRTKATIGEIMSQNGKGDKQRPTDKNKYDSSYERIFKDPEREAFEAINRCRTFEEAQACLKSNERGNNCPVCGLEQ